MSSWPSKTRPAIALLALGGALAGLPLWGGLAAASAPAHGDGAAARTRAEIAEVKRYWTPARMRSARPLELRVGADGSRHLRLGAAAPAIAGASGKVTEVLNPDAPPYTVNGRIFLRQAGHNAYCSGTAINSPSRQLVLTAGHCVATGPRRGGPNIMSNYLEFVPAYKGGLAPLGTFVFRRGKVFALQQWKKQANLNYDVGAFLTHPNAEGVNVADAVGGGATIVTNQPRRQDFHTFGYPYSERVMETCDSPYFGKDERSFPGPGPPTQEIHCHWVPGASGGAWLIGDGSEIDGLTSYGPDNDKPITFGPYFSKENVGKLVRGL